MQLGSSAMKCFISVGCLLGWLVTTPVYAAESAQSADAAQQKAVELTGERLQGSLLRGKVAPGTRVLLNSEPVTVAKDGSFVIGFDRDAALTQHLVVADKYMPVTLGKRDYRIQRINGLEPRFVTPPEAVLQRIREDSKAARAARAHNSEWQAFSEAFIWPATGRISGVYGSQRILNGKPSRPHFGVDIAAPTGTEVQAPASGQIRLVRDMYYSGLTVILDHGHGVSSTFLHLSRAVVDTGDWVEQGQKIAEIGSTGRSTGAHLDWRMNWFDARVDPQLLVGPMSER